NNGDLAVEAGDMPEALKQYGTAETMFPENLEMKFWKAVAMANDGQLEESKPIFKGIFEQNENWREMIGRLVKPGLLTVSEEQVKENQNL
ncbi:MAG: tetratricopeptide repeat protein, partial [Leeuwenhoekiella sp.]|nr:tetratricopeptide repeat protein [Leeuwenhoekiella sp.]